MPSTGSANDLAGVPAPQRQGFRFSLRALILFVLGIGFLLGVFVIGITRSQMQSKDSRARMLLYGVKGSANEYWIIWREYPPAPPSGRLEPEYWNQLMTAHTSDAKIVPLDRKEALDPWGNLLRIKVEKGKMIFWTCGPNGIDEDGNGDDIVLSTEPQ